MDRGIMSWEVFERVLESIRDHPEINIVVLYHGGEPLLNKRLYDMVKEIKQTREDIWVKTVSNGMAMTAKNAKKLVESELDHIEFSLDAESFTENNFVRRGSQTEKVISNIKVLVEEKRHANSSLPEIFISTTQFLRDVEGGPPSGLPEVPNYLRDMFSAEENDSEIIGFKSTYALEWPHMGDVDNHFDIYVDPEGSVSNECDNVDSTITIRWNGDIVPCCFDLTSKLVMGNVLKEKPIDIWNNRKYSILRDSIAREKFISICDNCAVVKPNKYLIPKWVERPDSTDRNLPVITFDS